MALRKCGDLVIVFLSARAAVPLSHLPLKFPFSPQRIFARCIKRSLDVATERLHHADLHHHGGSILFGDQDQEFDRRFGVDVTVVRLSSVFCGFVCSTTWNTSSFTGHGHCQCSLLARRLHHHQWHPERRSRQQHATWTGGSTAIGKRIMRGDCCTACPGGAVRRGPKY